jgi:haloacid dehalogenase-like hydrolase
MVGIGIVSCVFFMVISSVAAFAADPLPSWQDGAAKQAIVGFVEKVTTAGSPDFIPAAERIAVFDNDGTLWPENPVPFQLAFALDSLQQQLPAKPEWQKDPFVKAAVEGDFSKLLADHYKGLFHIIGLTHAGMTTEEFSAQVDEWMKTARHPRFGRPYDECIYQPMREVLAFLRAHGFKTYIVSGGGADFMRVWSERVYGIAPEQVVGSHGQVKFEIRAGKPALVKTMDSIFVDDKEGKPVGIHQFIGRRPVMAFGNSDGDKAMLEYTTIGNPRPSFGLIVHHTDAQREYAYDANPKSSGKLVAALAEAPKHGWLVVDMQRDWKNVLSDNSVTAIDVLLEPDATMLKRAAAVNDRLLKAYPKGFPLDATHRPHITLVQRFVRTSDLPAVYAAAGKVLAGVNLPGLKLEAFKHYYIPENGTGLAGIVIKPTPELIKLQQDLIKALEPFTVATGSSSAFVTTPDDLIINPLLIKYVEVFVLKASGANFNPHVTTGVATRDYLDKMLQEPFESFSFSPAGAGVYQLGQYGTAAKKLQEWTSKP